MARLTATATVLVVDDDPVMADLVADTLAPRGYCVLHAKDSTSAYALLDGAEPDLIILDLLLPDADGLVLCGDLQARTSAPIIVCSGSPREQDAVLSLRLGAHDFIHKPFRPDELEARVTGVLRRTRSHPPASPTEPAGGLPWLMADGFASRAAPAPALVIDHARRQARIGSQPLPLTATEYGLLATLAGREDEAVSREALGNAVWGTFDPGIGRSIDVHITRLRAKLAASNGPAIRVVRGYGYRLVPQAPARPATSAVS